MDVSYLVGAHDVEAFGTTLTVPVDVTRAVGSRAARWRVEETMEADEESGHLKTSPDFQMKNSLSIIELFFFPSWPHFRIWLVHHEMSFVRFRCFIRKGLSYQCRKRNII